MWVTFKYVDGAWVNSMSVAVSELFHSAITSKVTPPCAQLLACHLQLQHLQNVLTHWSWHVLSATAASGLDGMDSRDPSMGSLSEDSFSGLVIMFSGSCISLRLFPNQLSFLSRLFSIFWPVPWSKSFPSLFLFP